ncbi:T9SS sorting signal type C domain-containing protein [Flavobacterium granuli]|uniref:Fibronectin type-III domain-containing protein n=1 Tax=Flavobacterium granuli TaxID=280093 RepID=A0ABU1S2I0_9FLAO|nr:T9SS sorting signal type C domain-containing protein [Flavobacterium granuli]MDR6845226.1 hypothetical protein [Flavobacterium granuli]
MKKYLIFFSFFFCFPVLNFAQSIFSNAIVGANPNNSNPYTLGQIVNPNITVSGIGRALTMFGVNANNRYDAKSWKVEGSDPDTYFEFTLIPNAGQKIDFVSFGFKGQTSAKGPTLFAFRSSVDGFSSDIGTVSARGSLVSLSAPAFQNVVLPITFRIYGWAASAGTGTFSVNDFVFKGNVSCLTAEKPVLPETKLGCASTVLMLDWPSSMYASNYFLDVATDLSFNNRIPGFENRELGNVLSESISGLTAGGTYYVRLKSANSCGESDYSNTINVAPTETIYDGIWSNGIPDASKKIRFSSDYNLNSDLEACSCQIDAGVAVHVDSGVVLTLERGLDVALTGSLTFENNASLIQINNVANTGKIVYNRISAPMKNFDFTYWCSPVKDQVLNVLSPNTLSDKYQSYANGKWVIENGLNKMDPAGKGFAIRVPKPNIHFIPNNEYWTGLTYAQPVKFVGVPNNGDITIDSQGVQKDNLIGNPYPSAIDADKFINENLDMIDGGLYFWTHNTAITQSGSFYVYSPNDYAVYLLTGGVKATSGGTVPGKTIAAGQSFFVTSKTAGVFKFNNAMRNTTAVLAPGSNSQFFRMSKTKKTESVDKSRVWLNLTNSDGIFKQLLVGYITGATNEMDNLYDAVSFDGNAYADFYSINKTNNLAIQGRTLPFDKTDKVPLGYRTTVAGTFQISIDNVDGELTNQTVFLEDNLTKTIHNLKNGPYSFTTAKGTFNDRFTLVYIDSSEGVVTSVVLNPPTIRLNSKLDNQSFDKKGISAVISVKDHQININSFEETISALLVYDLRGRLLYENDSVNRNEFIIQNLTSSDQFLIVVTQLVNGKWVTQEIIFKN